jgi:hypothetical protein
VSRPLWIGSEVVGIPDDAVTFPQGERVVLVAWPQWRAAVVTVEGLLDVPEEIEKGLLKDYFGG